MLISLVFDHYSFICFFNASQPSFLIHLEQYKKSQSLKLYANILLKFYNDEEQYMFLEMENSDYFLQINEWQNLKCKGIQDDQYSLRGSRTNCNKFSLWEVRSIAGKVTELNKESQDAYLTYQICQEVSRQIINKMNKKKMYKVFFADPVDIDNYKDYYAQVMVGCDVGTIVNRL